MERIRNEGIATFIRDRVYPAVVLAFWLATAISALSQLITVKPVLDSIPASIRQVPYKPVHPVISGS